MKQLQAYAQLLRLPNVFTALADILLGWLAVAAHGSVPSLSSLWGLLAASACLYMAGMVLNDFFDIAQDRRERPFRPLPSGRIHRITAGLLGVALLALGVLFSWGAGEHSALVAVLLASCILAYDGIMKRTWLGPLFMGGCRFLNVLLACSASHTFPEGWMWHLAAVVGIYIVGVTLFARTEAATTQRRMLWLATGIMALAPLLAVILPVLWWGTSDRWEALVFPYALIGWVFVLSIPIQKALANPEPPLVQAAVKRCIFGLIVLDALLALAVASGWGLLIVLLILPAIALGKWVYST
jgi:4-hydroxybenzoate polyprenyltransferase